MLNLLNNICLMASEVDIPDTSSDDIVSKINSVFMEFDKVFGGVFYNIAAVALVVCIIGFVVSAMVFKSKGAATVAVSLGMIILGVLLFSMRMEIIGWFKHLGDSSGAITTMILNNITQ